METGTSYTWLRIDPAVGNSSPLHLETEYDYKVPTLGYGMQLVKSLHLDTAINLTNKLFMDYLSLRNKNSHNANCGYLKNLNFWQEDNYRYITKLHYVKVRS